MRAISISRLQSQRILIFISASYHPTVLNTVAILFIFTFPPSLNMVHRLALSVLALRVVEKVSETGHM